MSRLNLTIKIGLSIEQDNGSRLVWTNLIHVPPYRRNKKSLTRLLGELCQGLAFLVLPLAYLPG